MITIDRNTELARAIGAIEQASSPSALVKAVQELADLQEPSAVPTLIRVLGYNNPTAAVIAMQGLIAIGPQAVPDLLALMDDYNYGARAYTVRALATIADPRALDCLLACALQDFAPSVRRAAIKGLGKLSAQLDTVGTNRVLTALEQILQDEDWSIRYGAIVALGMIPAGRELLAVARHTESDRVVQAKIELIFTKP